VRKKRMLMANPEEIIQILSEWSEEVEALVI
jgi:hypothetical protein